jgi:nucleotide-binding universal stress UspA family protein
MAKAKSEIVVWGVDLTERDPRDFRKMADIVAVWKNPTARLAPLAILEIPERIPSRVVRKMDFLESAKDLFDQLLKQVTSTPVEELKLIFQKRRERPVQTFLSQARAMGGNLVAVQTHSRRGMNRITMGSFAEALIGSSPLPVLTVNPQTRVPVEIRTIVFAAKFHHRPDRVFKQAVRWAKEHGARLLICHKFETPLLASPYGGFGLIVAAETNQILVNDALKAARRSLKSWIAIARRAGVKCEGVIHNEPGRIAETVLEVAGEYKADVIVMSTHVGPLGQRIFGSAAREVVMTASCPVLVVHE